MEGGGGRWREVEGGGGRWREVEGGGGEVEGREVEGGGGMEGWREVEGGGGRWREVEGGEGGGVDGMGWDGMGYGVLTRLTAGWDGTRREVSWHARTHARLIGGWQQEEQGRSRGEGSVDYIERMAWSRSLSKRVDLMAVSTV